MQKLLVKENFDIFLFWFYVYYHSYLHTQAAVDLCNFDLRTS